MAYVYKTVNGVRKLVNVPTTSTTSSSSGTSSSSLGSVSGGANYTGMGGSAAASQQDLINQLQAQASGTSSLVSEQMKAASDKTLAQQLAAAGAARGGNQAALQRQLAKNQMAQGAELTQQVGQAQLKEQQAAQQQLASAISAQQQAALSNEQIEAQKEMAQAQIASAQYMQEKKNQSSLLGGLIGGAGNIIGSLFAEGGIAGEEESSEEESIAKKEKAQAFLKQLQSEKALRYKKATGKEAPELFKGDEELREEREEVNKKEIAEALARFHNKFLGGTASAGMDQDVTKLQLTGLQNPNSSIETEFENKIAEKTSENKDENKKNSSEAIKDSFDKFSQSFTSGSSSGSGIGGGIESAMTSIAKGMASKKAEGAAANGGLAGSLAKKRGDGYGAILAARNDFFKKMEDLEKKKSKK